MAKATGRVFSKSRWQGKRKTWTKFRYVYPNSPSKRGKFLEVYYRKKWQRAKRF